MSDTQRRHGEMTDAPLYAGPQTALPNRRTLPGSREAYGTILTQLWEEQGPEAHLSADEALLPLSKLPLKRWLHVEICPVCAHVFTAGDSPAMTTTVDA